MAKLPHSLFCLLICASKQSLHTIGANIEMNFLTIAPQIMKPDPMKTDETHFIQVIQQHRSDDDQPNKCQLLCLRPTCWVQKVGHLEDTLEFYKKNFRLRVINHVEYLSTCADRDIEDSNDSAYS